MGYIHCSVMFKGRVNSSSFGKCYFISQKNLRQTDKQHLNSCTQKNKKQGKQRLIKDAGISIRILDKCRTIGYCKVLIDNVQAPKGFLRQNHYSFNACSVA